MIVFSTTLFANPHHHNLFVHPDGHHAALLAILKQSYSLCHTSCVQLGHSFFSCPTYGWRLPAPREYSCGSFFCKIFSCCCSCRFSKKNRRFSKIGIQLVLFKRHSSRISYQDRNDRLQYRINLVTLVPI